MTGQLTILSSETLKSAGSGAPGTFFQVYENTHGSDNDVFGMKFVNSGFTGYAQIMSELNAGGASANLYLGTGGANTIRLNNDSFVGINKDPSTTLDVSGDLHTSGYIKTDSTMSILNDQIIAGTLDPFARTQIWNKGPSSILRLGSDSADGDPSSVDSEGLVVYFPSTDIASRIKADRLGLTRASDTSLYYFMVDQSALFYRANPPTGSYFLYVNRTSGNVGISTNTPQTTLDVSGSAQFGSGALKSTFTATPGADLFALQTSSGVKVNNGGALVLSAGGYLQWPDGTISTTAVGGGVGGIVSLAGTNQWSGQNSWTQPMTGLSSATIAGAGGLGVTFGLAAGSIGTTGPLTFDTGTVTGQDANGFSLDTSSSIKVRNGGGLQTFGPIVGSTLTATGQDANGYSLKVSSGISAANGCILLQGGQVCGPTGTTISVPAGSTVAISVNAIETRCPDGSVIVSSGNFNSTFPNQTATTFLNFFASSRTFSFVYDGIVSTGSNATMVIVPFTNSKSSGTNGGSYFLTTHTLWNAGSAQVSEFYGNSASPNNGHAVPLAEDGGTGASHAIIAGQHAHLYTTFETWGTSTTVRFKVTSEENDSANTVNSQQQYEAIVDFYSAAAYGPMTGIVLQTQRTGTTVYNAAPTNQDSIYSGYYCLGALGPPHQ
jgi:hypothetical protein